MDITTTGRVGLIMGVSTANESTKIARAITAISDAAQREMDRQVYLTGYTETLSSYEGQRTFQLKAYPIQSVQSVEYDYARAFDGPAMNTGNYSFNADAGLLQIDYPVNAGFNTLKVSYTGGMGTDVTYLVTGGYADLVGAVEAQVVHFLKRSESSDLGGYTEVAGGGATYTPGLGWLPWVKQVLDKYRAL